MEAAAGLVDAVCAAVCGRWAAGQGMVSDGIPFMSKLTRFDSEILRAAGCASESLIYYETSC